MALRINTNIASLNAHKNMTKTDNNLSSSLQRLSSGLRINKAADDASGMSIADSLKSQALGLGQAIKNGNDAINIVQTADAALEESINIVNTIKTKSIQAAQDGQTTESRAAIQADIDKLMEELDTIAKTTSFNGQKLLSGNFTNKKFQMGAYSGETVNVSIGSAQSNQIGHTTTGKLTLENNAPGNVEIAFYSSLQNANFEIEATEVKYNNSRENSLGMVADSINRLSDVLGITATADVRSTTTNSVGSGTLEEFSINGVEMNGINVVEGDTNRALTVAINQKTAQHGVVASIQQGHLTLTSTDGRAIKVEGDEEGMRNVFKGTEMSTVGHINLSQAGSNDIMITNIDGGNAVSLTNKMDIQKSEVFTDASVAQAGSRIAMNSVLGAGWSTNQDITTASTFGNDMVTTQATTLEGGSLLGKKSTVALDGAITGNITTSGVSTSFTSEGSAALGSTLTSGTVLGAGSQLAAGTQLAGDATINATGKSAQADTLKKDTLLAQGTVIASQSALSGVSVSVTQTDKTAGESTLKEGTTLAEGTIISRDTELVGKYIIEGTQATVSESTLKTGSIIKAGSKLGNGTNIAHASGAKVIESDVLSKDTTMAGDTKLAAGSLIKAGSTFDKDMVTASGRTITANTVVDVDITLGKDTDAGTGTLKGGSKLAGGSIIGTGTTYNADFTLGKDLSGAGITGDMTLGVNSELAGGSTLVNGSKMGVDITLKVAANVSGSAMTLNSKSVIGDGSTIVSGSKVAADLTLKSAAKLTKETTLQAGSSYAQNTTLSAGSKVNTNITLAQSSTLNGKMSGITSEIGLGEGTVLGSGSTLTKNSTLHASVTLGEDALFEKSQKLGEGSVITKTGSFIKAGSTVGAKADVSTDLSVINDGFKLAKGTKLADRSMLSNGSTIGGTITLARDEKVEDGDKMQVNAGSVLARGSKIAAGTYLTNDIKAADGNIYKAGYTLEDDIVTAGENKLNENMTLKAGSVIAENSQIAANFDLQSANAHVEDMKMERLSDINVLTQEGAQRAISIADSTLKNLDKTRADLGSVQNQLAATISNISTTRVNVFSAESTIRDVDFADESSNFTKMQVLQQAGTFAMSQANASAQSVLSLLQ